MFLAVFGVPQTAVFPAEQGLNGGCLSGLWIKFADEFPRCFVVSGTVSGVLLLGRARPKKGDEVKVHYVGTLTDGSEPEHAADTADTADMNKF